MEKKSSYQQMGDKWLSTCKPLLHTICKNELKWTKDLNVRAKIIKILEENTSINLHDLGFGNVF